MTASPAGRGGLFRFSSRSEEETRLWGFLFGKHLPPSTTVLLSGDLGTGKTVFVRGIGEALAVGRVRSPSFTLVNEYVTKSLSLAHVDLYRLEDGGLDDLDLQEYLDEGFALLVEWPERWTNPPKDEVISFSFGVKGETERALLLSWSGAGAEQTAKAFIRDVEDALASPARRV